MAAICPRVIGSCASAGAKQDLKRTAPTYTLRTHPTKTGRVPVTFNTSDTAAMPASAPNDATMHRRSDLMIHLVRRIAVATVLGAGLLGALALTGPSIGLGVNEGSVFYLWFGLSRTRLAEMAAAGAALGLIGAAFAFAKQPRVLAANAALTLAAIIVSLLLAEALARAVDRRPVFPFRNWLAERNALLTAHTTVEYDPVLGWVQKSDQRQNPNDPVASFTTGRFGIRLPRPGDEQIPAGAILAVGDSFTAGGEVGDRGTWPALLEGILARPVINGATGGWGTDQIVLRTEDLAAKLAPAMVIVSFFQDDSYRAGFRVLAGGTKPFFTIENGSLVQHNRPVPRYAGRPGELPAWLVVPSYSYLVQFVTDRLGWSNWWQKFSTSYVAADNDPVAVSCALLQRLQAELASRRIDLLLVMQYAGAVDPVKPLQAVGVLACARRLGIDTLDLWDSLKAVHDRSFADYLKLWASYDGHNTFGHMSPAGNRLIAEWIAAKLATNKTAE
jgi:hypothetical protein